MNPSQSSVVPGLTCMIALLSVLAAPSAAQPQPAADSAAAAATDTSPGAPSAEVQSTYRTVVEDAVGEYAAGNFAEARSFFLRAHELWPSARTYRTLGMTSYELRQYVIATGELEAALNDTRRPLEADKRSEVETLLEKARAFVGRYVVELSPPQAKLLVDGVEVTLGEDRVLRLNLGSHVLVARAPEHADQSVSLNVQGRESQTLVLAARAAPQPAAPVAAAATTAAPPAATAAAPESSRTWTWIGTATTVAFTATAVGLFVAANAEFERLDDECMGTCIDGEKDTSKYDSLLTASRVTLGLALAAAAGTVVAIVLESGSSERGASATLRLAPGALTVDGRF